MLHLSSVMRDGITYPSEAAPSESRRRSAGRPAQPAGELSLKECDTGIRPSTHRARRAWRTHAHIRTAHVTGSRPVSAAGRAVARPGRPAQTERPAQETELGLIPPGRDSSYCCPIPPPPILGLTLGLFTA